VCSFVVGCRGAKVVVKGIFVIVNKAEIKKVKFDERASKH